MTELKSRFQHGDHVRLLPFQDQPEEYGYFLEYEEDYPGMAIVSLWQPFITSDFRDDGIREVTLDQIEHTSRDPSEWAS